MSLKNNLKIGQAALEYVIIFSAIALLTILSLTQFDKRVTDAIQGTRSTPGFFQKAAEVITK